MRGVALPGLRAAPHANKQNAPHWSCGAFFVAPQAPAQRIRAAWLSFRGPAPCGSTPPGARARLRPFGPVNATFIGGAGIGRASDRKADRPPAGARREAKEQRRGRTRGGAFAKPKCGASERKADWPPAGARTPDLIRAEEQHRGCTRGGGGANQIASSSCCNSPASNISIMMSLPPTNSPFT